MNTLYIILAVVGAIILILAIIFLIKRSKGKIEIQLDSFNFSPGDTISGTVKINLKKDIEAKSVDIRLYGERSEKSYNTISVSGSKQTSRETNKIRVFDFTQPIAKAGVLAPREHEFKFSIKAPSTAAPSSTGNQTVDVMVKTAQILGGTPSPVRWYLEARLNCEGLDLTKKVQINIA